MAFAFEQLTVYTKALERVKLSDGIIKFQKENITRSMADQLSRAALSIPLNIAEGNGRWHKAEKRQFFWIARGSVFECVPIIQVLKSTSILEEGKFNICYSLLEEISRMLNGARHRSSFLNFAPKQSILDFRLSLLGKWI